MAKSRAALLSVVFCVRNVAWFGAKIHIARAVRACTHARKGGGLVETTTEQKVKREEKLQRASQEGWRTEGRARLGALELHPR